MKAPELPAEELYDLASDPLEMRNLAADPAARATLDQMRNALRKAVEETGFRGGIADGPRDAAALAPK